MTDNSDKSHHLVLKKNSKQNFDYGYATQIKYKINIYAYAIFAAKLF